MATPDDSLTRVLLVDDSEDMRDLAIPTLESHGCSVTLVADGLQAADLLALRQFDLVVTDLQMPGIDGPSLCRRIRPGPSADLRIILLSGLPAEGSDVRSTCALPRVTFLAKTDFWSLSKVITQVVDETVENATVD